MRVEKRPPVLPLGASDLRAEVGSTVVKFSQGSG